MQTNTYSDKAKELQKELAHILTSEGLPLGMSRQEGDGCATIIVNCDGFVEHTDDYAADLGYCGKHVTELPVSELGQLLDYGTRDLDKIDDLRG